MSAMDTLSTRQAVEIYQLATECQALGAELAKQFQNLSRLEAIHHAAAQATAHETINARRMAHNAAFSAITTNQPDADHEEFLHQFHAEADQAWKDTNDIIFSHQLKYDAQLAAFITTAEGTLQAKQDEIWSHIHSIMEAAGLPNKACLSLALQILEKLPTLPLDLSFCTGLLPRVLCLPSRECNGDGDYQLNNCARVASVLSSKLAHMAGGVNLDGPNPGGATSPTGSASSGVPCSPVCSPFPLPDSYEGRGQKISVQLHVQSLFPGTQQESPTTSMPDEGSDSSTESENDSESDGDGEVGSDDGDSDSSHSSDDESSSSSESDSGDASDDEGTQQGGSDNEGEGSYS